MKKRTIKPFDISGITKYHEWAIKNQFMLEGYLNDQIREKGYVPQMDITPELYIEYQAYEKTFKYAVVIYGTYVGKVEAQKILGFLGPHKIMKEPYVEKWEENDADTDRAGSSDKASG